MTKLIKKVSVLLIHKYTKIIKFDKLSKKIEILSKIVALLKKVIIKELEENLSPSEASL